MKPQAGGICQPILYQYHLTLYDALTTSHDVTIHQMMPQLHHMTSHDATTMSQDVIIHQRSVY